MSEGSPVLMSALAGVVAGGLAVGFMMQAACDRKQPTPAPSVTVTPMQTARQDAPRGHASQLGDCRYEDGNPDGTPCLWHHGDMVLYIDSSEYRRQGS